MKIKYFEDRIYRFVNDGLLPPDFELKEVSLDQHANLVRAYGYSDNGKRGYMWNSKGVGYRNSPFKGFVFTHHKDGVPEIVHGEILMPYNTIDVDDNS